MTAAGKKIGVGGKPARHPNFSRVLRTGVREVWRSEATPLVSRQAHARISKLKIKD